MLKNNKVKKICVTLIVGKPNVGKSTLFNKLINKKISITSKKKYTTQKNILGINHENKNQYIYIDTPGFKFIKDIKKHINNTLNILKENKINKKINLILLIIKIEKFFEELRIINIINLYKIPYIIIINKIDKLKNKNILLPYINKIKSYIKTNIIIPISAKKKKNILLIKKVINKYLIKSNLYLNKNIQNIYKKKDIFKEIIREKIFRLTGDEIPYLIKFKIKNMLEKKKYFYIESIIYVNKKQHIPILIGKFGKKIKKIIYLSKNSIEKYLNFKKKIILYINIKKYKW